MTVPFVLRSMRYDTLPMPGPRPRVRQQAPVLIWARSVTAVMVCVFERALCGDGHLMKDSPSASHAVEEVVLQPLCPGRKPPCLAVKRPARPHKSAIENRFTAGNATGASPPPGGRAPMYFGPQSISMNSSAPTMSL
jgi:hypothetical protein